MAQPKNPRLLAKEVPLNGKLVTAADGVTIGNNDFQSMVNMRYGENNIRGVRGMTRLSTNNVSGVREALQQIREYPGGSAVYPDVGDRESTIYAVGPNRQSAGFVTTNPPSTIVSWNSAGGFFSGSDLRLSRGPDGSVVCCSGRQTTISYGSYTIPSAAYNYDSGGGTFTNDILENVVSRTGDPHAIIKPHGDYVDEYTKLLLHNNSSSFVDSSYNADKVISASNVAYTTAYKVFGSGSAYFSGSGSSYLSVAAHSDFQLRMSDWTIDFWIRVPSSLPVGVSYDLLEWYQASNAYFRLYVTNGTPDAIVYLENYGGDGSSWIQARTPSFGKDFFVHIALVYVDSDPGVLYTFVNGGAKRTTYASYAQPNAFEPTSTLYQSPIRIGDTGPRAGIACHIDEFRISKVARWTNNFSLPTAEYGAGTDTQAEILIGARLPEVDKLTFGVVDSYANYGANNAATVEVWSSQGWRPVAITADTTKNVNGRSFSQTGQISVSSASTSYGIQTEIEGILCYWFRVRILNPGANPFRIYHIALSYSRMQAMKQLWDGVFNPAHSFQVFNNDVFNDFSTNIFEDEYDSSNSATYADIGGLPEDGYLIVGSLQRIRGLRLGMVGGFSQGNVVTMNVAYWNGTGWTPLTIKDGTNVENKPLAQSGIISWEPPADGLEYPTTLAGYASTVNVTGLQRTAPNMSDYKENRAYYAGAWLAYQKFEELRRQPNMMTSSVNLYQYKIWFSGPLSGTTDPLDASGVQIFVIKTIPALSAPGGYKFSFYHDDSLWLCSPGDAEPNSAVYSAKGRPQVLSGEECGKIYFGEEQKESLVNAVSISNLAGSSTHKMALFFKKSSVWKVVGEAPYSVFPLSTTEGCVAPRSLADGEVEFSVGGQGSVARRVAVWVSQRGVVVSDGFSIRVISNDIGDLFDPSKSTYLGAAVIATITGGIDPTLNEYHMVIPGGTNEYVYDFRRNKWFIIQRTGFAGFNRMTNVFPVYDANGIGYLYGIGSGGALYLLESGYSWNNYAITYSFRTPDIAPLRNYVTEGGYFAGYKIVQKSADLSVDVTHYGGGETSGSSLGSYSALSSSSRIRDYTYMLRKGSHVFHSLKFECTSLTDTFEPILLAMYFEPTQQDIRGYDDGV